MPLKYKPTKSSELPKPQKIRPTKITNCMVCEASFPERMSFASATIHKSVLKVGMLRVYCYLSEGIIAIDC